MTRMLHPSGWKHIDGYCPATMPDRRVKPCAKCHHPKSRHRTRECRATWQTRGQTFMGISTITKWCTCDGYEPIEEKS